MSPAAALRIDMNRMTKRQLRDALEAARRNAAGMEGASPGCDGEAAVESRFSELLADSLPGVSYLFEAGGSLVWWNRTMEEVTGYDAGELAGMSVLEFVAPGERELVGQRMQKVMEEGRASVEGHLVAKDGTATPYFFSGHRVEFAGAPCLLGMGLDLTDLKRTEQGLRLSEARKGAILEASLDCIITIDHEERVLEFNPAAERTFGFRRDEVLGQKMSELIIPTAQREAHRDGLRRYLETGHGPVLGRRIEMSAVRADGSEFPVEISIVGTVLDGQHVFTGYLRDITERKRIEAEVRRLNADLESRVEARTAELAAANEQLQAEVAERILVEEGYRQAKLAAEGATRAKDEFLAMMSHELRTPLNGVIGMVELLSDTDLDERQRRYAEVARTSADSLLSVINDILDLSRIESGKLELDPVEFNPSAVVEDVSTVLALRAEEKGLELAFQVSPEVDTWVLGDRGRLRQILTNLVANAIKFTERGEVVVRAEVEERIGRLVRLRVTVIDTGIGIAPDLLGRLFQPFTQADASTTRRYGGSGLGLAISRHLAHAMSGLIGAESNAGPGSTFWFTVTLEAAERRPLSDPYPIPLPSLEGVRALIVDDNGTNRQILCDQLTGAGVLCEAAANGTEAIARLENAIHSGQPFDLAILDLHMPGMSGEELGDAIKADPRLATTALLLLCSMTFGSAASDLRRRGFAGWAAKPLGRSQLLKLVSSALTGTDCPPDGFTLPPRRMASSRSTAPKPRQSRSLTILVAEDSRANQIVAAGLLERHGHVVHLANNGAEAVEAVRRERFDLILMDVQMPVVDGLSATLSIRAIEASRGVRTPIAAVTAHAVKGDRERCLSAGMDAYLSKPLRGQDLARVIDELVPGGPTESESPILDRGRTLARLDGDVALFFDMIDLHLGELPRLLADVRDALERGDAKAAGFTAHRLCGLAKSLDADTAAASAAAFEDAADAGELADTANASALHRALDHSFQRVRDALLAIQAEGRIGRP